MAPFNILHSSLHFCLSLKSTSFIYDSIQWQVVSGSIIPTNVHILLEDSGLWRFTAASFWAPKLMTGTSQSWSSELWKKGVFTAFGGHFRTVLLSHYDVLRKVGSPWIGAQFILRQGTVYCEAGGWDKRLCEVTVSGQCSKTRSLSLEFGPLIWPSCPRVPQLQTTLKHSTQKHHSFNLKSHSLSESWLNVIQIFFIVVFIISVVCQINVAKTTLWS